MPTEQEIRIARDAISQQGKELKLEKNALLDANTAIPLEYDIKLLKLIRKIIAHDQLCRADLNDQQRRTNLCNIAIAVGLISPGIKGRYNSTQSDYNNANIWSDLKYFQKFDIGSQDDPRSHAIYALPQEIVHGFLEDGLINAIDEICEAEIRAYQQEHGASLGLGFIAVDWVALRHDKRTYYSDHRNLEETYTFITYYRELEQLQRAIKAIELAEGIALGAGTPEPQNIRNKVTILRAFVVLGEACTKKNLTPQTKSLVLNLNPTDWRLFINLRNKLTHTEWDFHSKSLEDYIAGHDFVALRAELPFVREQLMIAIDGLAIQLSLPNGLKEHYTQVVIDPAPVHAIDPLTQTRALFNALANEAQAVLDKNNHPSSFDQSSMINSIQAEVQLLEAELIGVPLIALDDTHEEDSTNFLAPGASQIIKLFQWVNSNRSNGLPIDNELTEHISAIEQRFVLKNIPLKLEVPKGSFWPDQDLLAIAGDVQNVNLGNQAIINAIIQHFNINFDTCKDAIAQYRRALAFIDALQDDPTYLSICKYRIGRIEKFMSNIDRTTLYNAIGDMPAREARALRNYVQHGDDLVDVLNISDESLVLHYLRPIMRSLVNALQPLLAPAPVAP